LAEARDESFVVALKKVSRNTQFWLLFIAFAFSVGIFNSVTSLINQIVKPYGYDDDEAGYFGASFIVVGIFGAAISGLFVDKTKKYKEVLKCAAPCLGFGYIVFIFVIRENFFPWICIICGYLGFVSFALLPVALELGVECTYPCPPSTSTSG
jgi:FLVCR family MFS transporter 7